jgi:uncharacterized damage-inducible protein DinB
MTELEAPFDKAFLARQGVVPADLDARLRQAAQDFSSALSALDEGAFYVPLAEGKWSPAQIADHVVRANGLFARALERLLEGKDIIRMPKGRVTADGRAISPEEPLPNRVQTELVQDFAASAERLRAAFGQVAEAGRLGDVCIFQSFFGEMSALELMQLSVWHIRNHGRQIRRGGGSGGEKTADS